MELGKVKVVVVLIQKLKSVFFVHVGSSQPDAAEISLDGSFSHEEITEPKILIQLC